MKFKVKNNQEFVRLLAFSNRTAYCLLCLFFVLTGSSNTMLTGSVAKCENEGEKIIIPLISDNPCITCTCLKAEVVCKRLSETSGGCHRNSQGSTPCYLLLNGDRKSCCDKCKGCEYRGKSYSSGQIWLDPSDPCVRHTCQGGVITSSSIKCSNWCQSNFTVLLKEADGQNLKNDQCCPHQCSGCNIGGKELQEGDRAVKKSDPCEECVCQNGNLICERKTCPVLPCPPSSTYEKPEECCPQCIGTRKIFEMKNLCLVGLKAYKSGQGISVNKCTSCICQGSTMVCRSLNCEGQDAKNSTKVIVGKKEEEPIRRCRLSTGVLRSAGDTWKPDLCTKCRCEIGGLVRCSAQACPEVTCPTGKKLAKMDDKCCQQCVEEEGVCTVFGDPHYQTFDGKVFNYQGSCKYLLTKDCRNGANSSFSVKVRNDVRQSRLFSWTKTVTIQVKDVNIALEQHMVVRVHHKRVQLPYVKLGVVSITADKYNVIVRASSGLKVFWDGDSFLEMSIPAKFRNNVCGLCGNYNGRSRDDLKPKRSWVRSGSSDRRANQVGQSWRVGSRSKCSRRPEPIHDPEPLCRKSWDVRIRAVKMCNALKSSVFKTCHTKVSPVQYFKSCLIDMCECSGDQRCYCEALTAYAHACQRSNVEVKWRKVTNCENLSCPKGASYSLCGPACKKTCRNYTFKKVCAHQCVAGCQCPQGMVVHKNECILPTSCPNRKRPYQRRTRGKNRKKRRRKKKTRLVKRPRFSLTKLPLIP